MHFLLCAATAFEIAPTIEYLNTHPLGEEHKVDILITGVGLLPAAFHITQQIIQHRPQYIIQAGVAGSIDKNLLLGETVLVQQEQIGDSGVYEDGKFTTLFDMALAEKNQYPWTDGWLVNKDMAHISAAGLKSVSGVTVNEITTHSERIAYYQQCGAQVETLEGAALHYAGLMMDIPFLQIRSISNYVGERNKQNWKLKEAIVNLNHQLQHILIKLLTI